MLLVSETAHDCNYTIFSNTLHHKRLRYDPNVFSAMLNSSEVQLSTNKTFCRGLTAGNSYSLVFPRHLS